MKSNVSQLPKRLPRLAAAALVICAGCVTLPKPLYFTFDMTTPIGEGAGTRVLDGRTIDIDAVRVTDKLVRRDILIRLGATELEYYHDALWVSRLSDLAAEKLSVEFAPGPDTIPGDRPVLELYAVLRACEQVDQEDGTHWAHLKMDVTLRQTGNSRAEPNWDKTYEFYEPVDAEGPYPAVVVARLSEGFETLAAEIAADANALVLDESPR